MTRYFRFSGQPAHDPGILSMLADQSFEWTRLPFYDRGMALTGEPSPLGSSLAARFGYIYIQDPSSMLPALALDSIMRADGATEPCILDMCASPGGKSSLLASLAGSRAFVLANEPGSKRLATLRRNLHGMNLLNTGTCNYPGESLPLPSAGSAAENGSTFAGWDYILLDPPCSGWGTAEKNPRVLQLWQGEKLKPLVSLQKLLLREAMRLLRPGGALVYSTCTVNVQENEEQIAGVLEAFPNQLSLLPLTPFAGFSFDPPELALDGVLRVSSESPMGQGFFISALRKAPDAPPLPSPPGKKNKAARSARQEEAGLELPPSAIEDATVSSSLLPPGKLLARGGKLVFQHQGASLLPASFQWQGPTLGKAPSPNLKPRIDTSLRCLMPEADQINARGGQTLNLCDPAQVSALLSGQSLQINSTAPEVALYYKGLPLCRLKSRGGRVFI